MFSLYWKVMDLISMVDELLVDVWACCKFIGPQFELNVSPKAIEAHINVAFYSKLSDLGNWTQALVLSTAECGFESRMTLLPLSNN